MNVDDLLKDGRTIWGDDKLNLEQVLMHLGVVSGDLNRLARTKLETGRLDEAELQKEMGNLIFSLIRWCDDLGYSPEECIALAKEAQTAYRQKLGSQ